MVANATQDEIAGTLKGGLFERDPGMLEAGGLSLVDRLHREKVLTDDSYQKVVIKRKGPTGRETLMFPPYMEQWKAKIYEAYGAKPPG